MQYGTVGGERFLDEVRDEREQDVEGVWKDSE
jgi:hypothetical protein